MIQMAKTESEKKRLYRLRHPEIIREQNRKYRLRHPEKIKKQHERYCEKRIKKLYLENPELFEKKIENKIAKVGINISGDCNYISKLGLSKNLNLDYSNMHV
jgi:methionine synthase I (cobalamin-dependent)